jgi:pimeloyl-ACP methyl ester carboxylesterase
VTGKRPEIVFVPGLGAPAYLGPWIDRVAEWATVSVLDLPGWRGGRARRCQPTVAGIAAAVEEWLARPGGRVVLVGHSTAAQSVALVARAGGDRVAGTVLAGPVFDPDMRGWPGLLVRAARTLRHEAPGELRAVVPKYVRGGVLPVLRLLADGVRVGDSAYGPAPVPLAVLTGRHDHLAPPAWADDLAARIAADEEVVPGGHNFPYTHPDEADRALRAFVRRRCPE